MMLAFLPLIPLVVWGAAALGIGGGVGGWLYVDHLRKPPYKDAKSAYMHYVESVERNDYEMYQWSVTYPMPKDSFEKETAKREKKGLSKIKEGEGIGGRVVFDKNDTKRWLDALCPWSRKPKRFVFVKVGDSWKLDGDGAE